MVSITWITRLEAKTSVFTTLASLTHPGAFIDRQFQVLAIDGFTRREFHELRAVTSLDPRGRAGCLQLVLVLGLEKRRDCASNSPLSRYLSLFVSCSLCFFVALLPVAVLTVENNHLHNMINDANSASHVSTSQNSNRLLYW